jgi:hypothetical protein
MYNEFTSNFLKVILLNWKLCYWKIEWTYFSFFRIFEIKQSRKLRFMSKNIFCSKRFPKSRFLQVRGLKTWKPHFEKITCWKKSTSSISFIFTPDVLQSVLKKVLYSKSWKKNPGALWRPPKVSNFGLFECWTVHFFWYKISKTLKNFDW